MASSLSMRALGPAVSGDVVGRAVKVSQEAMGTSGESSRALRGEEGYLHTLVVQDRKREADHVSRRCGEAGGFTAEVHGAGEPGSRSKCRWEVRSSRVPHGSVGA